MCKFKFVGKTPHLAFTALGYSVLRNPKECIMKILLLIAALGALAQNLIAADAVPGAGMASWYGEDHRGRLMANGRPFNPDKLTAASWFYPLGSKVQVTVRHPHKTSRNVLVTITDRGPAKDL